MKALITGVTGQDGSYLAELLIEKGYEVYGLVRRVSSDRMWRIDHIIDKIQLIEGDMTDQNSLDRAIRISDPDETYNLAAQSFVGTSFSQPEYTINVTGLGCLRLLEAIRRYNNEIKVYHAGSSEEFGNSLPPQNESTPFNPSSPYAIAKVMAHHFCKVYRESYNMFISVGLMFNHESPRRGTEFVTRKITSTLAKIVRGEEKELRLGNMLARRDWGYAREYVEYMWKMLQLEKPDDYVIASGEAFSVMEFVEYAFSLVNLNWEDYVVVDENLYRPLDVQELIGDASKAKRELEFKIEVDFKKLVKIMVESDLENGESL